MIVSPTVVLSPSRVEGGVRCLRKHALAEICGQRPNDGRRPALEFGEREHAAAGAYWKELTAGPSALMKEGKAEAAAVGQEILKGYTWETQEKHTLGLALSCWNAYVAKATLMPFGNSAEWEVVTIEDRRYLELEGGVTLGFQVDRLLRRRVVPHYLALVDLKTAAKCDARWANQWSRSLQMKLYSECILRDYGQAPAWIIVEGLAKDKPDVHYVALPALTDDKRKEAMECVKHVARHDAALLERARVADGSVDVETLLEAALRETPFNPAECWSYNSACDYLTLCDAEPEERRGLLRGEYHWEQPKHLV